MPVGTFSLLGFFLGAYDVKQVFLVCFSSTVCLPFLPVDILRASCDFVALIGHVSPESLLSYGPLRFMVCFLGPLGTPFGPLQQGGMQRERLLFARAPRVFRLVTGGGAFAFATTCADATRPQLSVAQLCKLMRNLMLSEIRLFHTAIISYCDHSTR